MISMKFRIVLTVAVLTYYIILFRLIRGKKILLKYALVWITLGGAFLIFILFPGLLLKCANFVGIYGDVNFLFMVLIGLLMIITMSLTIIVSRLSETNKKLVQKVAMLNTELEEVKNDI